MAYDSYKTFLSSLSSPKDKMMNAKSNQVKYLYNLAMDREDGCTINGESFTESPRIFDRKIKANYFQSLICETINENDNFFSGDILYYDNDYWICTSSFIFHELYCKGDFLRANWKLKWQNESGEIIERWCVTSRQSSVGLDENKVITLGKSELKVLIPYDTETIKIRKGKRFYIDNNSESPVPYKTHLVNTTQYVQNGHGYLELIVKETTSNTEKDRPDLMICDYFTPTPPPDPTPTTKSYVATISCVSATIRVGVDTKFKAVFKDTDGNIVDTLTPKWTITSDFDDKLTVTEGVDYIQIGTKDKTLITKSFMLKLEATDDSAEPNEISILITSLF